MAAIRVAPGKTDGVRDLHFDVGVARDRRYAAARFLTAVFAAIIITTFLKQPDAGARRLSRIGLENNFGGLVRACAPRLRFHRKAPAT